MPFQFGLNILLGVAAPNATGVTNAQAKGRRQTSTCQGVKKVIHSKAAGTLALYCALQHHWQKLPPAVPFFWHFLFAAALPFMAFEYI